MSLEFTKPSKKSWVFSLLPFIACEKSYGEFALAFAWICWGVCITIDNEDIDKFDNFMCKVFKRTNPQMWFVFILAFIILANLL